MTQLLKVMEDFSRVLDNGNSVVVIFLSFKNAFNFVPLERVLTILVTCGISSKIFEWIDDFLLEKSQ